MAESMEKRIRAIIECDSTGVNKGLQQLNQQLKNNKSALNLAQQGVKSFGSDSQRLQQIQKVLAQQILLHAQKVDKYRQAMEKTTTKMKENIRTRDQLKQKLSEANAKYKEAVTLYGKESEQAKKAKSEVDRLTQEYNKKDKAVQNNAKSIRNYETNMNKANAELVKAQGHLKSVNEALEKSNNKWQNASEKLNGHSKKLKDIGNGMSGLGNKILGLHAPLIAVGGGALKVSSDFETSMSNVQAISGATGEDFKRLGDKAKELGAKTSKSAKESADAMSYQALAGWNVNQILEATEPILRLSEAGNLDLARASDLVTDSMSSLGIETKDLTQYLDICAQAQRKSNTTAEMMLEAYVGCGGTLKNLKVPLTESATWIGVLANRGIKGSEAGTSLNSVLINLTSGAGQAGKAMSKLGVSAFDNSGKFKGVKTVLTELNAKLANCTEEQKNTYLAMIGGKTQIDTLNAMLSGCSEEFNSLNADIKNSNGAMNEMAETMQKNLKGDITKLKSQLEGVGIQLGQVLIPIAKDFVATLSKWVDWFSKLDPATQKSLVKMTMFGVASGGALKVIGGGISTIGSVCGMFGKLAGFLGKATTATTAVAEASTVASGVAGAGGMAGLATSVGGAVVAFAPFIAGAGAVALAGYGIHKCMSEEVIPSVDLFADKMIQTTDKTNMAVGGMATTVKNTTVTISEETKKAVGSYIEMDKGVTDSLNNIYVNSTTITDKNANELVGKYNNMTNTIKSGYDKHYQERTTMLNKFFAESKNITDKEKAEILQKEKYHNDSMKASTEEYNHKIMDILNRASKEKRSLTADEVKTINQYQENMRKNAVQSLSKEEIESKVILERLKTYGTRVTAEQASNIIKNAEQQRVKSVDNANRQFIETKSKIEYMRDVTGSITAEQATKMIKEAERQKNETIKKAEAQKAQVIKQMQEQNSQVLKDIDTTDGSIMTKWDKLKSWFANNPIVRWIKTKTSGGETPDGNWTGNNYFRGGLTYLHERGEELYDLPRGTRIYNHQLSEKMVMQTAEAMAEKVFNKMTKGVNNGGGINVTQNIYTPTASPSEIARQTKNNLQQMALQW
ncbi:phage tail tape measure protein [Clostridium novyi]